MFGVHGGNGWWLALITIEVESYCVRKSFEPQIQFHINASKHSQLKYSYNANKAYSGQAI